MLFFSTLLYNYLYYNLSHCVPINIHISINLSIWRSSYKTKVARVYL